jgi:prophage regulatory protein
MFDTNPIAPDVQMLRIDGVAKRMGISKPTVYRMIERGEFPRPAKIGRTSVWPESSVNAFVSKALREAGYDVEIAGLLGDS